MSLAKLLELHQSVSKSIPSEEIAQLLRTYDKLKPYVSLKQKIDSFNGESSAFKLLYSGIFQLDRDAPPYAKEFKEAAEKLGISDIEEYNLPEDWEASAEEKKIRVDETSKVQRIIADAYVDQSTLLKIEPREFEEMVAELLAKQGFAVELTKQTRDNGFDILAIQKIGDHLPLRFLVECKRFTRKKVDVNIIRSFNTVLLTENANRGLIVTTSYFTKDAVAYVRNPHLLDLRDRDKLIDWIREYYKKNIS